MNSLRAVFLFLALAPRVSAQIHLRPAIADSSPVRIMAHVGAQAEAPWLRDVLRQADAAYPPAKLDQIGDSLVARAIDARSAEPRSDAEKRAVNAVNALTLAGAKTALRGRPYLGAFDRLIAVYQQSPARSVRIGALSGVLTVSSSGTRAVDFLSSVARASDLTGYYAVEFLITEETGEVGLGFSRPHHNSSRRWRH